MILGLVDEAVAAGARRGAACKLLGLSPRSVERWRRQPDGGNDGRTGPNTVPSHALTPQERAAVISIATSPEYRNISVRQLVPRLADKGTYIASESTFYRLLHAQKLMAHRDHARPARVGSGPRTHVASGPGQLWSWDITYLRAGVRGTFYYLYLVLDVWSRKVVGWDVHEEESMELSSALIRSACAAEDVQPGKLVLHSDNGGPMKGATMLATLQWLGVAASFSRPRVSDDNAICEAIFRTLKYRPGYPREPFASLEAARTWVASFVAWYNNEHLHSGIRYVAPAVRHAGRDRRVLASRTAVYSAARRRAPRRWTCAIRNWTPIARVTLNPVSSKRTEPRAATS